MIHKGMRLTVCALVKMLLRPVWNERGGGGLGWRKPAPVGFAVAISRDASWVGKKRNPSHKSDEAGKIEGWTLRAAKWREKTW